MTLVCPSCLRSETLRDGSLQQQREEQQLSKRSCPERSSTRPPTLDGVEGGGPRICGFPLGGSSSPGSSTNFWGPGTTPALPPGQTCGFPPPPPRTDTASEKAAKELQQQFDAEEAEQRREQEAGDRALALSLDEGGGDGDVMQLDADPASSHARRPHDARLDRFHQKWEESGFDMETLLGELTRPGGKKSHYSWFVVPTLHPGFKTSDMNEKFQLKDVFEQFAFMMDRELWGRYRDILTTLIARFKSDHKLMLRDIVHGDAEKWANSFQEFWVAYETADDDKKVVLDITTKELVEIVTNYGDRFPQDC